MYSMLEMCVHWWKWKFCFGKTGFARTDGDAGKRILLLSPGQQFFYHCLQMVTTFFFLTLLQLVLLNINKVGTTFILFWLTFGVRVNDKVHVLVGILVHLQTLWGLSLSAHWNNATEEWRVASQPRFRATGLEKWHYRNLINNNQKTLIIKALDWNSHINSPVQNQINTQKKKNLFWVT